MKNDIAFSENVYIPESLLSNCIVVSGVMVTTSLLFYHMSRVNTLKITPKTSKFISVSMILLSVLYLIYGILGYQRRMKHVAENCKTDKNCSKSEVKFTEISYIIITTVTILIQMVISYVVIKTI